MSIFKISASWRNSGIYIFINMWNSVLRYAATHMGLRTFNDAQKCKLKLQETKENKPENIMVLENKAIVYLCLE